MLYLDNTTDSQLVFIPKKVTKVVEPLIFTARNTIEHDETISIEVVDAEISQLYFTIMVTLPEGLANGEYEYALADQAEAISNGILVVGSREQMKEYYKTHTYEQYER